MPLSANSVVFLEMTILAESGVTFFEHEKKWCHSLCAFLLYSGTVCVHFYSFQALSVCSSIISQHFSPCAFLLCSALSACISITLQHSLHAFLLCLYVFVCVCLYAFVCVVLYVFVCVCMCLYVLVGRVAPQTRMLFRRTLYQNVPVLILLKINDMGPYGIHLTKWHLISRHHGEIYTTRSVQSDRTSNALCRFSHFGIHVPLNFYNFNPNFSLPVLLKV